MPLEISLGGTGSPTAAGARKRLGLEIGVDIQPYTPGLDGPFLGDWGDIDPSSKQNHSVNLDAWSLIDPDPNLIQWSTIDPNTKQDQSVHLDNLVSLSKAATNFVVTNGSTFGSLVAADLLALEALSGTGLAVRTGTDTWTTRSLVGSSDFTITNNDGVLGDPNIALSFTISSFAKTFLDDADASTVRSTIGANNASNLTTGTIPDARISNTLTADKAFRRGNILGTVSESSGVPTGSIIERGSNANGEYVRFADGTQICNSPSVSLTFATANRLTGSWTFPANFIDATYNVMHVATDITGMAGAKLATLAWVHNPSTAGVQLSILTNGAFVSGDTIVAKGIAIGRWF